MRNLLVFKLLEEEMIEVSDSPYASPIVPVIKKDGTIRFKQLNAKTIPKSEMDTVLYCLLKKGVEFD